MSRPNQMVTVGFGKERFSGPSVLARLHQGSQARNRVIEAAREAELARKATPISDLTSGKITRKKLGITAVGTAGLVALVAAVACKGGQGQEVKTTPTSPPETPVPTVTVEPTPTQVPTEIPTVAPTEVTTETPATIEEVRDAFFGENGAYSKLDKATRDSLPENQTQRYIEDRLSVCNGEVAIPDIPPDSPNYGGALISSCTIIPQEINGIPGREDILEFSVALEKLGSFTLDKVDKLWKDGKFPGVTEEEMQNYKIGVAAYFPK